MSRLWEKNNTKQKANTGKCFRDYDIIYLILFYPFNAMFNFYKASCWLQFTAYSWNNRCVRMSGSKVTSGAPNGKFWGKRPQNNNKVWIKLSEVIFSILGDCWKKCICSSLPRAQQDWRKSSKPTRCTYNLQPDLLEGGGGRKLGGRREGFWQIKHISYSKPWIAFFPATLSFQGHIISFTSPSQQTFSWRTDIWRKGSVGCPCDMIF